MRSYDIDKVGIRRRTSFHICFAPPLLMNGSYLLGYLGTYIPIYICHKFGGRGRQFLCLLLYMLLNKYFDHRSRPLIVLP
jgi:hypothetical protein